MAVGKNKKISKGKKGGKRRVGDPFQKKEWYTLKAPAVFSQREFGKTLVTRSQGTKLAVDGLKGRVFEVNLADLNVDEAQGFRKIKLRCEEVEGKNCLTDFDGMSMTRHSLCSLVRKWHSLIEATATVRTVDGYVLRIFCIAFSRRGPNQVKSTCYIRESKTRAIRKRMIEIIEQEATKSSFAELCKIFQLQLIEKAIATATKTIFPLQNIYLRKVKVLKKGKTDTGKMEESGEVVEDFGQAMLIGESEDAQNLLTASL